MLRAELKSVGGQHDGKLISLDADRKFLIGREQDCHLRPNSESISRHHCVFTLDEFCLRLRDLGSTNGTAVNGESITSQVRLEQGDRVTVGPLEFEVVLSEVDEVSEPETRRPRPTNRSRLRPKREPVTVCWMRRVRSLRRATQ
ncbi:MAG: hypothetical protein Ct9H300mP1_36490 [Planctomycetaceae bacterium]|nr:MAG: hypothetical protein Ct9H300mP1_36490 [Planctomycetaceae bacterium]